MALPETSFAATHLEAARLIMCVLPDDGTDRSLIRRLRDEHGVTVADSTPCRGISVLQKAEAARVGQLPEASFVKLVQIVVPEAQAHALFDFIYSAAHIGRLGGGMIVLSQAIQATAYRLPQGVPNETD